MVFFDVPGTDFLDENEHFQVGRLFVLKMKFLTLTTIKELDTGYLVLILGHGLGEKNRVLMLSIKENLYS